MSSVDSVQQSLAVRCRRSRWPVANYYSTSYVVDEVVSLNAIIGCVMYVDSIVVADGAASQTNESRPGSARCPLPDFPNAELVVDAMDRVGAQRAERIVIEEIDRLDRMFRADDASSLMCRWIRHAPVATANEFDELLSIALRWQDLSGGVFNVSTGRLARVWEHAAADGCRPSAGELREIAVDIARAPYQFDGHLLRQVRSCGDLDLRAIVPGFIADLAVDAAWRLCDLRALTLRADTIVVHRGVASARVPLGAASEYLANRELPFGDAAVVTRTGSRTRNVFDPRSGQRVVDAPSVTVVASSASVAEAVATVVTVLTLTEGREFVGVLNASRSADDLVGSATCVAPVSVRCWWFDESGRDLGYAGP